MLISVRGRVEADPMRVPLPAATNPDRADAFADVLQERLVADRDMRRDVAQRQEAEAPRAEEPVARAPEETPVEPDEVGEALPQAAEQELHEVDGDATARPFELEDTTRRGEPVRQETAGKGADSPRPSSAAGEQLLINVLNQPAPNQGAVMVAGAGNNIAPVAAAKSAGTPLTRAAGPDAQLPNTPQRSGSVTAGYRTNSAASAQLLEQARDSVFKQILLKLNDGGGEMRLRLEPPDLGELDLRLSVEGGNRLHLAISAERDDMTELLQRHLDELTKALRSAGLDVAGAHVEARGDGARRDLRDAEFGGGEHQDKGEAKTSHQPRMGGWVTAEGLDYWA